ncbi:MAG: T9SS type A sorting domain-containing protein, partial [Ferruginibacter sp.]
KELWNSNWNSKRDSIGIFAKFVPPTIANGKVYMATFSKKLNVYGLNPPPASPCAGTLPPIWQSADIGYDVYAGDVCVSNGTYTITASGAAIGGKKDGFHYVFQNVITNSTELTIRVNSFVNNTSGSRCGIMFRQNLDQGSPYVFLSLSPDGSINSDQRTTQNGASQNISSTSQSVPYYLRIYNSGNTYTSTYSYNGYTWYPISTVTLAMGPTSYVGIAFTRNSNSSIDTAIVDNVALKMSGVLSVNLINFNGKNEDNKNTLLNWSTSSEINIDHFEIQRSSTNTDFNTIGTVKGNGSTSELHQYTFTDFAPQDGANYYRLKQVGVDGNFSYSSIIPVRFNLKKITIYPNPAQNKIYISNNQAFSKGENINVELLDFGGKTLYKRQFKTDGVNINTLNIPTKIINGMYIIIVTNIDGDKQGRQIFINR